MLTIRWTRVAAPRGRTSHAGRVGTGRGAAVRECQSKFRTGFSRFRRNCSALDIDSCFRIAIFPEA
jgi:hypothetical protein